MVITTDSTYKQFSDTESGHYFKMFQEILLYFAPFLELQYPLSYIVPMWHWQAAIIDTRSLRTEIITNTVIPRFLRFGLFRSLTDHSHNFGG